MDSSTDLRYPIGRQPAFDGPLTGIQREPHIQTIAGLPAKLRQAVRGLSDEQWETPYRPGGWTVRQLVHHIPDSHANAYIRFKMALTENAPTIKPYDEAAWAELADTRATPPEVSLTLLEVLHARWVVLLRTMPEPAFQRSLFHPEHGRSFTLDELVAGYAWHSEHHLRHITALRERLSWK